MNIINRVSHKSRVTIFVYAFLLNLIIGYVDYATG